MMQKPHPSELSDFLNGTANELTSRRCEELFSTPDGVDDTVTNLAETLGDDSLLSALKMKTGDHSMTITSSELDELTGQIENLVPRHVITADEISRLLDPSEDAESIGCIGRFEVIEFIASGGMGLVFHAVDPELKRDVCIKLLSPSHEFSPEAKSRFDREAREMAAMNCERIVTVLEVGLQKGLPFFVMPLLPGSSLRTLLNRHEQLSHRQSSRIIRQLTEGPEYAHNRGVLHRDIKPANLWVLPCGDIKILDFGLAHIDGDAAPITHSGTVIGTPGYMSPEQINGKPLDARSDMFSVGVVIAEILTGKSPFQKANLFSTLMSVASEKLEVSELDPDGKIDASMRRVLSGLLQKEPADRTASATELLKQLDGSDVGQSVNKHHSLTSGSHGRTYVGGLLGIAFGFAACLLAFSALDLTDKGTLVVSTNDPDVKIQIAAEKVVVVDPVSTRRYEIRIGETPLPSGVYQLETTSADSGLSFSSQVIAIRRGEKSIVTVELVPLKKADKLKSQLASKANTHATDTNVKWADPTYDPDASSPSGQKRIAEQLRQMKGLNLQKLGYIDGNRISNHATVTQSELAKGKLWSVENATIGKWQWSYNADRTMQAAKDGAWLQIRC